MALPVSSLAVFALWVVVVLVLGTGFAVFARRSARLDRVFYALPPPVRLELLRKPARLNFRPETQRVSILSARVALCDPADAEPANARFIERTLIALIGTVCDEGGTVVAFSADGFTALWNAPTEQADYAAEACTAAARMMTVLRDLNRVPLRHAVGHPRFDMAVGLATGQALTGAFGGSYSVFGAAMARAERLRALAPSYGFAALADEETERFAAAQSALLPIDRLESEAGAPQTVFALLGDRAVRAGPKFRAVATFHAKIFDAFAAQDIARVQGLIAQARRLSGASEKLYDLYAARLPQAAAAFRKAG